MPAPTHTQRIPQSACNCPCWGVFKHPRPPPPTHTSRCEVPRARASAADLNQFSLPPIISATTNVLFREHIGVT
jgi:hypothetical protein